MSFPTRDEREVLRLRKLGASLLDRLEDVTNERDVARKRRDVAEERLADLVRGESAEAWMQRVLAAEAARDAALFVISEMGAGQKRLVEERDAARFVIAEMDRREDVTEQFRSGRKTELREERNPCEKIFEHKHLDWVCVESGCQSLFLAEALAARNAMRRALRQAAEALAPFASIHEERVMDWLGPSDFRRVREAHGAITAILSGCPTTAAQKTRPAPPEPPRKSIPDDSAVRMLGEIPL